MASELDPPEFSPLHYSAGQHGYEPKDLAQEVADYIRSIPTEGEAMQDLKQHLFGSDGEDSDSEDDEPCLLIKLNGDPGGRTRLSEDQDGLWLLNLFAKFANTLVGRDLFTAVDFEWAAGLINGDKMGCVHMRGYCIDGRRRLIVRICAQINGEMKKAPWKSIAQCTIETCAHEFVHLYLHYVCCHGKCTKEGCDGNHSSQLGSKGHGWPWEVIARAVESKMKEFWPTFNMNINRAIRREAGFN